ncbi:helix-turn-helix domain-containing protein [Streptomyces sp. NPDC000594]|uniref:helix-turn-helix domain-containing protein n=1 Tax=Streptomyces sp. NPDC000594 TaxID=3154261 RepID=UPI00331ECA69
MEKAMPEEPGDGARSGPGRGSRAVRPAPDHLRSHVISYTGYEGQATTRLHVPSASVSLCLAWEEPILLTPFRARPAQGGDWLSVVVGSRTRAALSETRRQGMGIVVDLTPLGAFALLRTPLRHLAQEMTATDEVIGAGWSERVTERLATATDWATRWEVLDRAIEDRCLTAPRPSPVVLEAWSLLRASRGRTRVEELARATGCGRRRLEVLFGEQIGLPPKSVARILRFQHALAHGPAHGMTWAETAARCGYHDQAHLSRDFRDLTGLTPTGSHTLLTGSPVMERTPVDGRISALSVAPSGPAAPWVAPTGPVRT